MEVLACKISGVDLHPRIGQILEVIHDRNGEALLYVTAALDASIQETYAQSRPKFPPHKLRGVVLATNVRNLVLWHSELDEFKKAKLRVKEGANCSVLLIDPADTPIRVRKHPRRNRTELAAVVKPDDALIPVTHPEEDTLFGLNWIASSWEPAVLWDADPGTESLRKAWLGALERDKETPRIFGKLEIPIGSAALYARKTPPPAIDLGWDDEFPNEDTGDDLA
ncbi:hypothetical protein [Virgisporangium ochraceum]|nr:hypothetical protein [Virgisporangium ochraceum]